MSRKGPPNVFAIKLEMLQEPPGQVRSSGSLLGKEFRECIRALQRNRTNKVEREMQIYYADLSHGIIEAEKSNSLLCACWRPKVAGGVIPA